MKQRRKCQECGNVQYDKLPPTDNEKKMEAWLEHKCLKCGSIGLDYGTEYDWKNSIGEVK